MFFRPTRLIVNLSALEYNYNRIREIIGPRRQLCAVVKANGYGLGAIELAHHLEELGCDCFGIATLKEAAELRRSGIMKPVILLGALYGRDSLWEALLLDLEISIHHMAALDDIEKLNAEERAKLTLHLKVNTGMSRLGIQPHEIGGWCKRARALELGIKGVFTTFSSSEQISNPRTQEQIALFQKVIVQLRENGFDPPIRHAANSGAILNFPESLFTMVRPGILLHGVPSAPDYPADNFCPVARLESEIVQITDYPAGTPFGYSASQRVERATRAAVIPIGYADGLNRQLSNRGEVLVRGLRAPILGKISMDLIIVDVTDIDQARLGDAVTILGSDGDDEITAWELAEKSGSIPWELFCWIGPRVPRIYTH
jgi:alanine racemase